MLVSGSMIGSGIFIAPSLMAKNIGAPGIYLGLWVLAAAVTVVFNLDAAVVLLTPLYIRIARRHGYPAEAFAFWGNAVIATGTLVAGSLFSMQAMASGYMQDAPKAEAKAAEGKCGEGKCGEGKCGGDQAAAKGSGASVGKPNPGKHHAMADMDADKDGRLSRADAGSIAGHYGSVSVVTFAVGTTYLARLGQPAEGYMTVLLALLEFPALVIGVLLARRGEPGTPWSKVLHEVFAGKSIVLLLGGLAIGWFAGPGGIAPLDRLFFELGKKKRLARLIEGLGKDYDRIILDCPPGLTETSEQVLRAADVIVVPVIPSPLSQRALGEVARYLMQRGDKHPPILPVYSMVDRRRSLHRKALEENPLWPVVPMASAVEQMSSRRKPLGEFAGTTPAAKEFSRLWQAIEKKLAKR